MNEWGLSGLRTKRWMNELQMNDLVSLVLKLLGSYFEFKLWTVWEVIQLSILEEKNVFYETITKLIFNIIIYLNLYNT